jgi:integral membrane protein (TIGR00529 family)
MNSIKIIFKKRKLITISMPLLIGLMPSVGGAYFSAPMVAETTKDLKISSEEKSFINYWFRHPWEFILPLYPGILLASAITKIELHNLISANLLFAFLMLTTGFLFSMKGLRGSIDKQTDISKKGLWSFAPIISVLCFVLILHVELHLSLLIVITFLLVFYKYKPDKIFSVIKYGFSLEILILIFGVMLFKETLESSGAVGNLSRFFIKEGVPLIPILFLLPFITGFLTGITVGFVGSTFPLIINITNTNSINIISFAFASGFLGVLLSPVHICLILTKEYFKADMAGIYKIMITPCLVVMAGALIEYLILTIP